MCKDQKDGRVIEAIHDVRRAIGDALELLSAQPAAPPAAVQAMADGIVQLLNAEDVPHLQLSAQPPQSYKHAQTEHTSRSSRDVPSQEGSRGSPRPSDRRRSNSGRSHSERWD